MFTYGQSCNMTLRTRFRLVKNWEEAVRMHPDIGMQQLARYNNNEMHDISTG